MSKLKLSHEYTKGKSEDLEIRKGVKPVAAPRFKVPVWLAAIGNGILSGGIGIGCAWLALYFLGKI